MYQQVSSLILVTLAIQSNGQNNEYQSTTLWWDAYKPKLEAAYTTLSSLSVNRLDTVGQQKKAAAIAHINTLLTINDQCDQNNMAQVNQGPAIVCAKDQEQRFCEFGWAYNPLGTKQTTCVLIGTPYRGNCCTITFPGAAGAGGGSGGGSGGGKGG